MNCLLISTYELGHQPFNLASPAAHLSNAGHEVHCLDASVQRLDESDIKSADFIGISIPMHTAMRIGMQIAPQVKTLNPTAHLNFYGLYAGLHSSYLLESLADSVVGGEYEQALVSLVDDLANGRKRLIEGVEHVSARGGTAFPRQKFLLPARHLLPPLHHYARLHLNGELRMAGYVELSRGCAHKCRHCPITPVYNGRLRVVQHDVAHVDPVQYSIRLLLPPESPLLTLPETRPHLRGFDELNFIFLWEHPDPRMDELHRKVAECVQNATGENKNMFETFGKIKRLAYEAIGRNAFPDTIPPPLPELNPPRLTEDWFC